MKNDTITLTECDAITSFNNFKKFYNAFRKINNLQIEKKLILDFLNEYVYPYENTNGEFMSYDKVLETAIHEFIHHLQYSDHNFKRKKGIMHDPSFWKLYNHYIKRADSYDMLEVSKYEHKADVE